MPPIGYSRGGRARSRPKRKTQVQLARGQARTYQSQGVAVQRQATRAARRPTPTQVARAQERTYPSQARAVRKTAARQRQAVRAVRRVERRQTRRIARTQERAYRSLARSVSRQATTAPAERYYASQGRALQRLAVQQRRAQPARASRLAERGYESLGRSVQRRATTTPQERYYSSQAGAVKSQARALERKQAKAAAQRYTPYGSSMEQRKKLEAGILASDKPIRAVVREFQTKREMRAAQNLSPAIKALEQTLRPVHAVAGGTRAALKGQDVLKAVGRGARLKDRYLFSDVLKAAGVKNKTVLTGLGLGLDIALDPLTYVTFGAGSVARTAATRTAQAAARKAGQAQARALQGRVVSGELSKEAARDIVKRRANEVQRKTFEAELKGKSERELTRGLKVSVAGGKTAKRIGRRVAPKTAQRVAKRGPISPVVRSTSLTGHLTRQHARAIAGRARKTAPKQTERAAHGARTLARHTREGAAELQAPVRPATTLKSERPLVKALQREQRAMQQQVQSRFLRRANSLLKRATPDEQRQIIDALELDRIGLLGTGKGKRKGAAPLPRRNIPHVSPWEVRRRLKASKDPERLAKIARDIQAELRYAERIGTRSGMLAGRIGARSLTQRELGLKIAAERSVRSTGAFERELQRSEEQLATAKGELKAVGKLPSREEYVKQRPRPARGTPEPTVAALTENVKPGKPGISIDDEFIRQVDPRTREQVGWGRRVPGHKTDKVIVARDDHGKPIGALKILTDADGKPTILEVAVDPAHRGKGLAMDMARTAHEAGYDLARAAREGGLTEAGAAFTHKALTTKAAKEVRPAARARVQEVAVRRANLSREIKGRQKAQIKQAKARQQFREARRERLGHVSEPTLAQAGAVHRKATVELRAARADLDRVQANIKAGKTRVQRVLARRELAPARERMGAAQKRWDVTEKHAASLKRRYETAEARGYFPRQREQDFERQRLESELAANLSPKITESIGQRRPKPGMAQQRFFTPTQAQLRRTEPRVLQDVEQRLAPQLALYGSKFAKGVSKADLNRKLFAQGGEKLPRNLTADRLDELAAKGYGVYHLERHGLSPLDHTKAQIRNEIMQAARGGATARGGQYKILRHQLVRDVYSRQPQPSNKVGRGIDIVTGGFKSIALLTPAYLVKNFFGDLYNAYGHENAVRMIANTARGQRMLSQMGKYEKALTQFEKQLPKSKRAILLTKDQKSELRRVLGYDLEKADQISAREVALLAEKLGVIRQGRFLELMEQKGAGKIPKATKPRAWENVSKRVEDSVRMGTFLGGIQRGMTPREAAARANEIHFDYGDLTHTERTIFRRLMPFYTFTARNVPLQAKIYARSPGKVAQVEKAREEARRASGLPRDYAAGLDPYEARQLGIPFKTPGGKLGTASLQSPFIDLSMLGVAMDAASRGDPLEVPEEVGRRALDLGNPFIKTPLELIYGYSFFYRDKIKQDTSGPREKAPQWAVDFATKTGPVGKQWGKSVGLTPDLVDDETGDQVWGWRRDMGYAIRAAMPGPVGAFGRLPWFGVPGKNRRGMGATAQVLSTLGPRVKEYVPSQAQKNRDYVELDATQERIRDLNDRAHPTDRQANGKPYKISENHPTPEYVRLKRREARLLDRTAELSRKQRPGGFVGVAPVDEEKKKGGGLPWGQTAAPTTKSALPWGK